MGSSQMVPDRPTTPAVFPQPLTTQAPFPFTTSPLLTGIITPETKPPISTNSPMVPDGPTTPVPTQAPFPFPSPLPTGILTPSTPTPIQTNPTLPTNPPSKPPTNPTSESSPTFFPTPIHSSLPIPPNMLFPAPTKYPSSIHEPSYNPYYPPHNYPQSVCKEKIYVDKECYLFGEPIKITYELCHPSNLYWFGIFQQGSCDKYGRMRKNPYYWEFPLGGHGEYLVEPKEHGIVTFNANLSAGHYQVYSISNMNRPYQSTSSSYGFVVSNQCL